jgi:microcystin-dependent protein
MATVDGMTAAAMQTIANATVVSAEVNGSGHLILTKHDSSTQDAGAVTGATGPAGPQGPIGPIGTAPTGSVVMWPAVVPPTGWLLCNGQAISQSTYASLYSVIGNTYGVSGSTFNVPNFQAKFPRMDTANLALSGGESSHQHGILDHDHQIDGGVQPAAAHILLQTGVAPNVFMERISGIGNFNANFQGGVTSTATSTAAESAGAKVTGFTQNAGLDNTQEDSTLPPYLNINFIIKI